MARILWGIIITAAGVGITFYANTLYENFGAPEFAERYFGGRFFFKLLGIVIAFAGFLTITNLHRSLIIGILGLFFPDVR
ncbi:hypothetical protein HY624_01775 [Candidatus Uhrbacteria bacterium]|nr:hypothetical protein [Candidatus Uhrbacteria bacterium]